MKKVILLVLLFSSLIIKFNIAAESNTHTYFHNLKDMVGAKGERKKALTLHKKALAFHKKKNYKNSEKYWYEAAMADPSWARTFFNLACTAALQGENKISIEYLKFVISIEPEKYLNNIRTDNDLKSIRGSDEFNYLFEKKKSNVKYILTRKIWQGEQAGPVSTLWPQIKFKNNGSIIITELKFSEKRNEEYEVVRKGTYKIKNRKIIVILNNGKNFKCKLIRKLTLETDIGKLRQHLLDDGGV